MHSKLGLAIGAVAVVAVALAGCSSTSSDTKAGSADSPGVTATTISVGTLSDQTGPTAGIQLPWLHGLQALVKKTNADGGVGGRTIKLLSEDDKYDVAVGQPAFKKLVSQTPTVAILGLNTGNVQAAILPLVAQSKVPLLTGQASIKEGVSPTQKYFFGMSPTYADQVDVIMAYAAKRIGKTSYRVAVINNGTATGTEVSSLVKERAKNGITDVGDTVIEPAATTADAQIQTIIGQKPDVIVFHGNSNTVNLIGKSQQKFGSSIPIIGIAPSGGPSAFAGLPPKVGNLFEYVQWASPTPIQEDGTADLVAAAKDAGFADETVNPDFVAGYAAGMVLVKGLTDAGKNLTRDTLRDAIEKLSDFSTGNLTPNISFSATDHVGVQLLRPLKWNYDTKAFDAVGTYDDYKSAISNEYIK